MDYKIVKANSNTGTIDVMYLDDTGKSLAVYPIDVPIVNGVYISGNELESLIQSKAPTWLLIRKSEVTTAKGFDAITAKVDEKALQDLIVANTPPSVLAGIPTIEPIASTTAPLVTATQVEAIVQRVISNMASTTV